MYFEKKVSYILLFLCLMTVSSLCLTNFSFGSPSGDSFSFSITTEYYGANSREIEQVITMPIEDAIADIPGIRKIRSSSEFGKSRVTVSAKAGTDMNLLYTDIRERVDRARTRFPKAVQKTRIVSSDSTNHPVFIVSCESDILGQSELGDYADGEIKSQYQRVRGTGEIEIGGQGIEDIEVVIDGGKASQYGIDAFAVSRALEASYVRIPAGSMENGETSVPIFFDSKMNDIDDFKKLLLRANGGQAVKLSEIASVSRHFRKSEQISRIDGEERIILYIYSGGSVNVLGLCEDLVRVTKTIARKGLELEVIYNKGDEIRKSIDKILVSMAVSMVSLFLFIGLFLPDFRARMILSASIPLSIFLGIAGLSAFGIPVDASIISGLTIGSGLIIDNYLIIYDYIRQNRDKPIWSIAFPLLSGTLTTLIVFLPLIMLRSMNAGIQSISFSICGMLAISQLLTFTFLPQPLRVLCAEHRFRKPVISFDAVARPFFFLTGISQSRKGVLRMVYLAIILSVPAFLFFGQKEFTPIDNDSILFIHVEFPSGTTIAEVDKNILPYIGQFRKVSGVILVESNAKRSNAEISVTFDTKISSLSDMQHTLEKITGNSAKGQFFYALDQNTQSYKVYFTLTGSDHAALREKVKEIGAVFSAQSWVTSVVYHFKEDPPAYEYRADARQLSGIGVYPETVASILRWNVQGPVSLKWISGLKEHDVRIRGDTGGATLFDLGAIPVLLESQAPTTLGGLGKFIQTADPERLYRENRQNSVSFTIETKRLGLSTISVNIDTTIRSIALPTGFGLFPDESLSEAMKNYQTMYLVFLLAVFLIYALLAIQNESFAIPLLIISAIPFSAFFPLAFLAMLHKPISSASIIGIIILSGTSVNNFILIIDTLRNSRTDESLLAKITVALRRRFNPLFLSCGTSIIAAIPILFSAKPFSDFPSALAIIITLGVTGSFVGSFLFFPAIVEFFIKPQGKK